MRKGDFKMKALTIKQPYAALIINGYKKIEFRSWKTNYRGKILIHAGLSVDKESLNNFKKYNLEYVKGAVIGKADIADCILIDEKLDKKLREENPLIYRKNHVGQYAWLLDNIIKYKNPIYKKGKLGLWKCDL